MLRYLITLQVPDKKGLVEQLAHTVSRHGGNWLDSELRHIDGIFAAILLLEVPTSNWDALIENFECIEGLSLTYAKTSKKPLLPAHKSYSLVAYDRPGLVHDISNKISALGINIEHFSTQYESAGHSGIALFRATFNVDMKSDDQEELLSQALYAIGNDIVLDRI
ncbi:amino acid-binding protein [Shewanella sp. VB17]|uniref:glycine cleavage system protein R n=1 Tax=Shewanella sp. VB17 TaxID=2739432 RepID=UPI0015634159|nr:ACT domain-containing protein [Shewanella sp. VB17]NRD73389.1 amino acid-binding protein [Shewanella sp. VB17]